MFGLVFCVTVASADASNGAGGAWGMFERCGLEFEGSCLRGQNDALSKETDWKIRLDQDHFLFALGYFGCCALVHLACSWMYNLASAEQDCLRTLAVRSQLKKIKLLDF